MTAPRWVLVGAALALVLGAGLLLHTHGRLPSHISTEELVQELAADAHDASLVAVNGRYRPGVLAPVPGRLTYRVHVPDGGALRLGLGVIPEGRPAHETAGVRFAVRVDGKQLLARLVNPARHRDHRWFDERLDLARFAGGDVDLMLETSAVGTGPPGGRPAWSNLALVREGRRERQGPGPDTPNVVLLLVDTLRADRLGCYGASPSPSPTLDRLAAGGTLFEHAISQSSWTLPSVGTILTGLHPRSHGMVGGPSGDRAEAQSDGNGAYLPDSVRTIASEARLAGITTLGVSANPIVSSATNLARGFETFVEFPSARARTNWTPARAVDDSFLTWLRENRRYRFFAYLHYMEPHAPYSPPEALRPAPPADATPHLLAGVPPVRRVNLRRGPLVPSSQLTYLRALYDGEIRAWDDELATLLRGLEELGLRESTLLIVTADHGEEFQEHERLYHGSHLYEESIRVPLVIAGPAVKAQRIREQAQGIDVFPTVAARLGFGLPPGLPGRDLLAPPEDRPVFSETRRGIAPDGSDTAVFALRTLDWKLIHEPARARFELYDLRHDPAERTDRYGAASEGPDLVRTLLSWEEVPAAAPPASGADPDLRRRLRALGYAR